jgi:hypothetical protein
VRKDTIPVLFIAQFQDFERYLPHVSKTDDPTGFSNGMVPYHTRWGFSF